MGQIVELGTDSYSQFMQRAELRNVTQVPTNSGNASVQLATFPQVRQVGKKWLADGEEFLDVQRCFDWIVCKVRIPDPDSSPNAPKHQCQIRARKLTGEVTGEGSIRFAPYADPDNRIYPFQTLEFTDKNGIRWVIILSRDAHQSQLIPWKFQAESNFASNDANNPAQGFIVGAGDESENDFELNKLYEVFVEGYFYEFYKSFKDYDFSGHFGFNGKGDWKGIDQLAECITGCLNGGPALNTSDRAPIMSAELRKAFIRREVGRVETEKSGTLDTPQSYVYYDGLAGARDHLRTINSGNQERGTATLLSPPEATEIMALASAGAAAGGFIGSAIPIVGMPIGAAIGAAVGASVGFLFGFFGSKVMQRWDFMGADNLIKGCSNIISIACGNGAIDTVLTIDGIPQFLLTWSGVDIKPGDLVTGDEEKMGTPLGDLKIIKTNCEWLTEIANSVTIQTRFIDFLGSNNDVLNWRVQHNYFNAWVNGGIWYGLRKIRNNFTGFNSNYYGYFTFDPDYCISKIPALIQKCRETNLKSEMSTKWKLFAESILTNTRDIIKKGAKGTDWLYGEVNELFSHLVEQDADNDIPKWADEISLAKTILKTIIRLNNFLGIVITGAEKIYKHEMTYLPVSDVAAFTSAMKFMWAEDSSSSILRTFKELSEKIEQLRKLLIAHKSDYEILDIESLSHMLMAITENDRFYYSDIGTTTIQGLNFYSAEYSNSTPIETWRLGNRLVLFTNNTIEFWDITNDFEDPLSPAYSSNVYSMSVIQNSRVKFNDTLYFIAKPVELDAYSVYSLTKNGELKRLSYPQLDKWLCKQIFTDLEKYNPGGENQVNYNFPLQGSVINYENAPIVQWKLKEGVSVLNYNAMFNTFFLSDNLSFLENGTYFQLNSNKQGTLDKFEDEDGKRIHARIITVNSNDLLAEKKSPKKYKSIVAFHGDAELENFKNENQWNYPLGKSDPWALPLKADGNLIPDAYQEVHHKFYRVSRMPWESLRTIRLMPRQGNRNVNYKVIGIGMGIDFQSEISWNGFLRINSLAYEVE
jgi:hypothetical protein